MSTVFTEYESHVVPTPSRNDTGRCDPRPRAVAAHLGLEKTLLGVAAALDGKIAATDASEADLLRLLSDGRPGRSL